MIPSGPSNGMPRHVAIIMDGNGRWASQRGKPRSWGHRQGVEALRRTVPVSYTHLTLPTIYPV